MATKPLPTAPPSTPPSGPSTRPSRRGAWRRRSRSSRRGQPGIDGRESYAARVTLEDVRAIRRLRGTNGTGDAEGVNGEGARIAKLARWLAPFFDLKEAPIVKDAEGRRLFISEGTEAARMMIQRCEATSSPTTESAPSDTTSDSATNEIYRPPVQLLSILAKPAPFFDPPTCLLADLEKRGFANQHTPPPFHIIIGDEEALSEIVGFPVARGAMACGVVPAQSNAYAWLERLLSTQTATRPRRLLALDAASNAANVGSILRTAAALGIDAVILSDDCCDAWYRQSVRVSLGHVVNVPTIRVAEWERGLPSAENSEEGDGREGKAGGLVRVLQWLRARNVECLAAVVNDAHDANLPPLAALETYRVPDGKSWCCVLGNEGNGLRNEVVRACDRRLRIGMAGGVDSLSLPMAAGILIYGLAQKQTQHLESTC
ncbi:hypothetical protein ACHAXT_004660 [Thalassiosira profunda]